MRILQLAPPWEPVPPPAYGGTELVVHLLTEELVRQGHEVTLVASGDSRTSARLLSPFASSLRKLQGNLSDYELIAMDGVHIATALQEAATGDYDVIHNHDGELAMLYSNQVSTPILTTLHGKANPAFEQVLPFYPGFFNGISASHIRQFPKERSLGHIYHGIDVETFPFQAEKDDYLLFLSRISPEKGPLEAIEVARRLGKRLIMAGKVSHLDLPYHREVVLPHIDGEQIVFLGEADAQLKRELYRSAKCMLLPLQWDEPFGLVMIEAMACGTPVAVFRRGSAPELIVHGVTGFVVDTVEQMTEAVRRVDQICPEDCRRHVETEFSVARMAENYLELYQKLSRFDAEAPALQVF